MEGTFDMACIETCPLTTYYGCLVIDRTPKQTAGLEKHLKSGLSDGHSALTFCPGPFLAHLSQ